MVWEPVLATDLGPPLPWVFWEIADGRALQFWDRRRALSKELRHGAEADPSGALAAATQEIGATFWDYIAFFPPGVRRDSPAPNPNTWDCPVVHHMAGTQADQATVGIRRPSPGSP